MGTSANVMECGKGRKKRSRVEKKKKIGKGGEGWVGVGGVGGAQCHVVGPGKEGGPSRCGGREASGSVGGGRGQLGSGCGRGSER